LCRGQIVIAINDVYRIAQWATYHYFCDRKWYNWHKDQKCFTKFRGVRITQDDVPDKSILRVRGKHDNGMSFDPTLIHYGSNSGFQALNIAVLMGASRVLLLGYDMRFGPNDEAHWFGDHPDKVRSNYCAWLSKFSIAADQLKSKHIEVINCSRRTALRCFKRENLESVLSSAQDQALQKNKLVPSTVQG
jgi:hypothetical protein